MAVEKFTISFPEELAERVRELAEDNVSAWLADAAAAKLRSLAALKLIKDFEDEHGEITEAELEQVRKKWRD
ncbi:MAG TPA: hypothetical protein VKA53_08050 [Thermoanaerobaculia bacterium]|nr:hypothetical protein [Thermoanaerobaculia bacterium]